MKITKKQLRKIIREITAGSPTIGKPSTKGTDHLFTDTYGLGREDSMAGMNPQSDDREYMRGYNEAQLDAGLPKVQPPSEPATAKKLDPNKLKGAFVSSKKDRSEMAEYIRKRNERMAKLKMSENKLRLIIRKALLSESSDLDSLYSAALKEMGDDGPNPEDIPSHKGGSWGPDDWMEYLYEAEAVGFENVSATIAYVKAAFPDLAAAVDEAFSETGPRTLGPAYEAFAELLDTEDAPGDPLTQSDTAPGAIRVSPIKVEDGMQYRWWLWGSNIDPYPIAIDAKGMDGDDKVYTAEEMFQQITGGKESRFKVPKGLNT